MIDSQYFLTHLQEQLEQVGENALAELHLHGGKVYEIAQWNATADGYALLTLQEPCSKPRNQLAVAYESISHVLVTKGTAEKRTSIGFAQSDTR
jgi:hypothetical protein